MTYWYWKSELDREKAEGERQKAELERQKDAHERELRLRDAHVRLLEAEKEGLQHQLEQRPRGPEVINFYTIDVMEAAARLAEKPVIVQGTPDRWTDEEQEWFAPYKILGKYGLADIETTNTETSVTTTNSLSSLKEGDVLETYVAATKEPGSPSGYSDSKYGLKNPKKKG